MPQLLELVAGTEVRCTDGRVGRLRGLIFDAGASKVTHLSVDTRSGSQNGRLAPLESVQSGGDTIELGCDKAAYHKFQDNEEFVTPLGRPGAAAVMHVRLVPHGETELTDQNILATDGRAGHLVGAVVDGASHDVRTFLVRAGHFGARHQVSVPFSAVEAVDKHGVRVRMSKAELSAQSGLT